MAIRRVFLDWSRPALHLVADQLLLRSRSSKIIDLSHLVLVFYGSQAGRRCLELLTEKAGGHLCPPRIITVGELPELLYTPKRPFASTLVQQLVWAQALQNLPPERLHLFVSAPPAPEDQAGWLRLGDLLRRLHAELSRDQLDFADVWKKGTSLPGFNEVERWKLLSDVQQVYWRLLDSFELWDQQTARLEAIRRQECHTNCEIVTVGTVDLNRTLRSMLHQVSDQLTVYVPAPESWADRFDAFGCLIPERWIDQTVDLDDDQILMADDAPSQCATVLSVLAELDGQYTLDEITIGMPDQQLVVPLQRVLQEYGVPSHWPVDCALSATAPYRLLESIASFLEEADASNFSALIRHPDVGAWLNANGLPSDWLARWDRYFNEHLPRHLDWILEGPGSGTIIWLKQTIEALIAPLSRESARFVEWGPRIEQVLSTIYGTRLVDPQDPAGRRLLDACQKLHNAFTAPGEIPEELDHPVSAHEAIRFLLRNAECDLYHKESETSLQLVGWLEIPLDDAPVTIVTTFNESFIPTSVNHDLFLPNRMRSHLGIEDNTRRYARDLYLLSTLVPSRRLLRFIVARRDAKQDPLAPSRLLFATDPERIAQRVLAFYEPAKASPLRLPASPLTVGAESAFPIPMPMLQESPRTVLRVTEFRDYLASPYRYYLRHILQLKSVTDDLDELDGAAFGTLVHEVLKLFGSSERCHSSDALVIENFLHEQLKLVIAEKYGEEPLAAVLIQSEQARRRLSAFARWQADWRRDGWEIHAVEQASAEPVPFPLKDGRMVHLKGRIDRIDYHPQEKRWAIFDYKTGDAGAAPEKTHRYRNTWVDLQLPLYRHLAAETCGQDEIQLGYIVLPRDAAAVTAQFAAWSDDDLAEADETARNVAGHILDQNFRVPLTEPASTMTEFDTICQVGVFGQEEML